MTDLKQLNFFEEYNIGNNYGELCSKIANVDFLSPDEFGNAIRAWAINNIKCQINVVALFSGAGGLDIGFCDAGFTLIESIEIEEKFVQTMLYNQKTGRYFTKANILAGDIKQYEANISDKIDFVIGGPPCQSFSAAGRRAAGVSGTKDDRGSLFEEYVRILEKLQPKGFLFENVSGLLGAEKGESIKKIVQAFKNIGYNISYRVLDTADYGVPQHRERLIIVGCRDKIFKFPKPTHGIDSKNNFNHYSAEEAIKNIPFIENNQLLPVNGRFGHLLNEIPHGLNYSFFTEKMGHPNPIFAWRSKFSDFLYKADPRSPVRTLKASGGQYTGPFHWDSRHFHIEELKRLQTFPDDYKILGNRAIILKQIGNSVPPQFARILALSVLEQFFNIKLPFELHYLEKSENLSFRKLKSKKAERYQEKANNALINLDKNIALIVPKEYNIELTKKFKIKTNPESGVRVVFKPTNNEWIFELFDKQDIKKRYYMIELKKDKEGPMFLSVKSVKLISYSSKLSNYTVLWKILEKELAENKIKADLIQLNGYYQYKNDILYSFTKYNNNLNAGIWKLLVSILNDRTIGQIKPLSKFVIDYNIQQEELIKYFCDLREIGFEIRNSNTNPEIAEDEYLVPYKFPTLSPLSVQLNKTLIK